MKIFKLLSTTLAVLCFSSDLLSDITFYGKINTSYESTDKNSKTDTDFKNNASRPVSYTHLTLPTNREV